MDYFKNRRDYELNYIAHKEKIYKLYVKKYKKDLGSFVKKIERGSILEIWFWDGKFANFCNKLHNLSYIWIDVDDFFAGDLRKHYPYYKFLKSWISEFADSHKNEFDVVFVSHVFEHLDDNERIDCINWIYWILKKWGYWINYMPNADSDLMLWYWRWGDITHYTIYNSLSFSQLLRKYSKFTSIEHSNTYVWYQLFFFRWIHKIFLWCTKVYYLWMWVRYPEIYTWELLSFIKK